MSGQRRPGEGRQQRVEPVDAVQPDIQPPGGEVDGDEGVQGERRAQVRPPREGAGVAVNGLEEGVEQSEGIGEGLALEERQGIISQGEHQRVATGFGVAGEHACVRPEHALGAVAGALLAAGVGELHFRLPQFGHVPALESEGLLQGGAFEPGVGGSDVHGWGGWRVREISCNPSRRPRFAPCPTTEEHL